MARPATQLDSTREETGHATPHFLPDGKHFLFQVRSRRPENSGVHIGSLDGNGRTRVSSSDFNAAFAPPGYLIFVRGGTLVAQLFNWRSARLEGEAASLVPQVWALSPGMGVPFAGFSVSATGLLAYRAVKLQLAPLVWFDRQGRRLETVGEPAQYSNPALSPDGKRLAVAALIRPPTSVISGLSTWRRAKVPGSPSIPPMTRILCGRPMEAGSLSRRTEKVSETCT